MVYILMISLKIELYVFYVKAQQIQNLDLYNFTNGTVCLLKHTNLSTWSTNIMI